eukprot:comp12339_c0_seq1/m.16085 comp12339_c0_seq1/g.16085  ORF comp12339_c0_seq1/g.16085 comp12339_c0_seq1/m.16085 type:complete len:106 (+) comp12339_c0_seq1:3-320(+)
MTFPVLFWESVPRGNRKADHSSHSSPFSLEKLIFTVILVFMLLWLYGIVRNFTSGRLKLKYGTDLQDEVEELVGSDVEMEEMNTDEHQEEVEIDEDSEIVAKKVE